MENQIDLNKELEALNTSTEEIDQKAQENEGNGARSYQHKELDKTKYVDLHLGKGELTKEVVLRIIPFKDRTIFKQIRLHNVEVDVDGEKKFRNVICLHRTKDAHIQEKFGDKCPFCEVANRAYKDSQEATDETEKKNLMDVWKNNTGRDFFIFRAIVRGKENEGVKFYRCGKTKNGTGIYEQIMKLYNERKPANIFDLFKGSDIKITVSKMNEKHIQLTYSVIDKNPMSPVAEDKEVILNWMKDPTEWYDVYSPKSYDYLSILLEGKVPTWDKDQGKYVGVAAQPHNSEEDAAEAEKATASTVIPEDLNKGLDGYQDVKPEEGAKNDSDDTDDLPF